MQLIRTSIERRVGVVVGVLLVALFGLVSLARVPIQLTPEVSRPEITVSTFWSGAGPEEVEQEIIQRQEDELKSVQGVLEMKSESRDSEGRIVLTFDTNADMDAALLRVSNQLNQVKNIPADAERPVISSVNTDDRPIAWFILKTQDGNTRPVDSYQDFAEDHIKARFERVPGVARSNVLGGRKRQMQVRVDPSRLAAHGLTLQAMADALRAENVNLSAGSYDEGKRRYLVRTLGELDTPEKVAEVVLRAESSERVRLGDIAEVSFGFEKKSGLVRQLGDPAIAVNVQRESGANVLDVMVGLKAALAEMNAGVLADAQLGLEQVYDETVYIEASIELVRQNLWLGGLLAILVLLIFLRAFSPTLVVATAIPISVVGTFIVMLLLGRTLNVISLAGLAFATGMVVDNAIVVLENIYRHRQLGKSAPAAAYDGTREVWGAVLSSTLTTIAVFLPIFFIREEAGQLFRDIAIAISAAVGLSLVVSITVIPSFSAQLLRRAPAGEGGRTRLSGLVRLGDAFSNAVAGLAGRLSRSFIARVLVIALLVSGAMGLSAALAPKPEYLPEGNRNLIFAILIPPAGYNVDEFIRIGQQIEGQLRPHWEKREDDEVPALKHFFFVARGRSIFMGMRARNAERSKALIPFLRRVGSGVPGMFAIVTQASLFSRGLGGGRSIDVELSGPDLAHVIGVAGQAFGMLRGAMPDAQARPIPSLGFGNPEVHVVPDRVRLSDLGLTARELGLVVDAFVDGAKVSTVEVRGEEIDLVLMGPGGGQLRSQDLEALLLRAPGGERVPLSSVADVRLTAGPEQINHSERVRTITLSVRPPEGLALQAAMDRIQAEVLDPLRAQGRIGGDLRVRLAGTADKLDKTFDALKWSFLLALIITFLLMSALFESFLYPVAIMLSVPLAMAGGFLGLWVVSALVARQPLDVLTMLGFVILVGTVVNNAILIVHQALQNIREGGLDPPEALRESVRTRVRPIFMSVTTSVFGMLPLILLPGAGSELYRGVGSVVVGGLLLSTFFTLVLTPALFSLLWDLRTTLTRTPAAASDE